MERNAAQKALYVAQNESVPCWSIDTSGNTVVSDIPAGPPAVIIQGTAALSTGNNTNSVALSPENGPGAL